MQKHEFLWHRIVISRVGARYLLVSVSWRGKQAGYCLAASSVIGIHVRTSSRVSYRFGSVLPGHAISPAHHEEDST
jgi:hypothetical protein